MDSTDLHALVWRRFVRCHREGAGLLLDYADENGCVPLPTAEECARAMPNVLGWWTPIENGSFFTGLYLYALCERFDDAPDASLAGEIAVLAHGLMDMCDVGSHDGFIARGVADDGRSHYPFSSEDQFGPWVLGLYRLLRSTACTGSLRGEIVPRMLRTLHGAQKAGWNIPTEWDNVTRGSYAHADWRGCAKLLFCSRVLDTLDGTGEYDSLRDSVPSGAKIPYTRAEIVSHGFAADMVRTTGLIQFWIDVCAHLSVYELVRLDPSHADAYRAGLRSNGVTAAAFLGDHRAFKESEPLSFSYDWRVLEKCWHPWTDADEAVREAGQMCSVWSKDAVPGRHREHSVLGNMLFGSWICLTCGDPVTEECARSAVAEAIGSVDFSTLHLCYAFVAEGAVYLNKNAEDTDHE